MITRSKVLAIDDEEKILSLIQDILSDTYEVVVASTGQKGIELALTEKPNLVLVDNIMPNMSGIEATQFIRKCAATKDIPIIMLTALKESPDRTRAFRAGVDDFISKPFHPDELMARIESKIHRFRSRPLGKSKTRGQVKYLNLRINFDANTVYVNDKIVRLTALELKILAGLLAGRGKVQSREKLCESVWEEGKTNPRALDAHFTSLRKKLRHFSGTIATVYGQGYVIREE